MTLTRVLAALALIMAVAALALTVQERTTRADREEDVASAARSAPPTLTIHHVEGPGRYARSATHVPPNDFGGNNAICPKGSVVIGGGASIAGPGVITDNHAGAQDVWRVDLFNATSDVLGFTGRPGDERANLSVSAVCLRGDGIKIKTEGLNF